MMTRVFGRPFLSYAGCYEIGIWWLRICGWGVSLRSHWNAPLFAERNGYDRPLLKYRGWRVLWIPRNQGYSA